MRFNHTNTVPLSSFNGFVPPTANVVYGRDSNGHSVILQNPASGSPESYQEDLNELRTRLQNHNWHYRYHQNLEVYNAGYHNERAIMRLVERWGGIFTTLWETERSRNLTI